jgi:hypothetical protein
LARRSILVSWWTVSSPQTTLRRVKGTLGSVGGDPAKLQTTSGSCGVDANVKIDATIERTKHPGDFYRFQACLRGPDIPALEQQVKTLLSSAHLTP